MISGKSSSDHTRPIFTVSELTHQIKTVLEQEFPLIWITGEISNLRIPSSGHYYFTLKDRNAQINTVIFKGQVSRLHFKINNGLAVTGLGRLAVYEPRGTYQLIFEHLEPKGMGALQLAFEQLKSRLAEEGLFDDIHKSTTPLLPQKIHVITSSTGAVVHDTIQIIQRRFANMPIVVIPTSVQGPKAEKEIIQAINLLNRQEDAELAILARGGGSLEDLAPFNSEGVARAIFASKIPIISAVGHETDFTIADFVADMRASTPSAAAELAVPEKDVLQQHCYELTARLVKEIRSTVSVGRDTLEGLIHRLRDPKNQIQELRLKLDDISFRLNRAFKYLFGKKRMVMTQMNVRLNRIPIYSSLNNHRNKLEQLIYILLNSIRIQIKNCHLRNQVLFRRLRALNPTSILNRGYSITRSLTDKRIIKDSKTITIDQQVEVQLSSGILRCRVEGKKNHG